MLSPYLGQTVKFSATLAVEKGDIIGITVPTWAPGLLPGPDHQKRLAGQPRTGQMHQLRPTSARASRRPRVGTRATYGCKYSTARLLYTVTVVSELTRC